MATATLRRKAVTVHQQIERIHAGLSFPAVQNLQRALDLPLEKMAAVLGMSRATLHRRKTQGKIDQLCAARDRMVGEERLLIRAR